jgi:hypothetical protein
MPKTLPEEAIDFAKRMLRSKEEKEQEKEISRESQARLGKAQMRRHIEKQRGMVRKLWAMGKRALSLNDEKQFRQIGKQLISTQDDIDRWERYLLSFEVLEAKRDQARTSAEFLKSLKAMSESIMASTAPQDMAKVQQELEQGLARAATLEERMSLMMDALDSTIAESAETDDSRLSALEQTMTSEQAADETSAFDAKIEAGLSKIREEMKKST